MDNQQSMGHRYELDHDEPPSMGVVDAVSAVENRPPLDLPPLAEAINPDALARLFAGGAESIRVSFRYCGYEVTVTSEEVRVRGLDTE